MTTRTCSATKRCSRCQEWKPRSDFVLDGEKYDGLRSRCRACDKIVRAYHAGVRGPRVRPSRAPQRYCTRCFDLTHRRDRPVCRVCGKPYEAEPPIMIETYRESALADAEVWA